MEVIMDETGNKVVDLSFKFALDIIQYTESLEKLKNMLFPNNCKRVEFLLVLIFGKLKTVKVSLIYAQV
jgi:hypothetical protein